MTCLVGANSSNCIMAPSCPVTVSGQMLSHMLLEATHTSWQCFYTGGVSQQSITYVAMPEESGMGSDQIVFGILMVIFVLGLFWGFRWTETGNVLRGE